MMKLLISEMLKCFLKMFIRISTVRCTTNNGGCEQICAIENDQVQCRCYPGYELAENRRNCSGNQVVLGVVLLTYLQF